MKLKINFGVWNDIFAVPSSIVDNYIKTASGDYLKLLLCILRNGGNDLSPAELSSLSGLSEELVEDGIDFWKQRQVIFSDENEISLSQEMLPANKREVVATTTAQRSVKKIEQSPNFLPKEIAGAVNDSENVRYLFSRVEQLYGRALKHIEQNTVMSIIEYNGLPVEVALILIEYCCSVGKNTPAYMKAVATDWMERGIITIELAEQQIVVLNQINDAEKRFRKKFEVHSAFSKQQRELIQKWVVDFSFDDEMIEEAYELTLNGAGKLSFGYMDKILTDWYSKGVKSKKTLEAVSQKRADDNKPSFDINEIERLEMSKYTD